MALILSLAILEGFDRKLHQTAEKFSAHIIITSFNREPLPDYENTIAIIKHNFDEVKSVEPIVEREGLIRSSIHIDGITINGVIPELSVTGFDRFIIEGEYSFSSTDAKEVIISQRLSQKLGVGIGDKLVIFTMRDNYALNLGGMKADNFIVTAIYKSGMVQFDDVLVLIPYDRAIKFFDMPEGTASSYKVMLNDMFTSPQVVDSLEAFLRYPYFGFTIFNYHGSLFSWIELQKEPIPLVLGLISLVAVLNIITTLLITILEKTNTIGILRTLGMRKRDLLFSFISRGFSIGLLGTLIGVSLAYILCKLQDTFGIIKLKGEIYFLDELPIAIVAEHYLLVAAVSLTLAMLATIIPATIAVTISPLRAIRFQ
jgi:lipoprotein-releasing system permease protein